MTYAQKHDQIRKHIFFWVFPYLRSCIGLLQLLMINKDSTLQMLRRREFMLITIFTRDGYFSLGGDEPIMWCSMHTGDGYFLDIIYVSIF